MMKFYAKFFSVFFICFLMLSTCTSKKASAEEVEKKDPTISGIVLIDSASVYVDKMSGETLYRGFVVQPSAMIVFERLGVYFNVTAMKVADGKRFQKSSANSVEYSAGYEYIKKKDEKDEVGIFKIDVGGGFSDIKNSKGDLYFLYIIAELPNVIEGLTPYIMAEVDIPVEKKILEGGFLYRAGVKYALKVSEKQEINFDFSLAGHDGVYGYRSQPISSGRLTVSTLLEVWGLEVTPEINFQKYLGLSVRNGGIAEDVIWFGMRIALPIEFL